MNKRDSDPIFSMANEDNNAKNQKTIKDYYGSENKRYSDTNLMSGINNTKRRKGLLALPQSLPKGDRDREIKRPKIYDSDDDLKIIDDFNNDITDKARLNIENTNFTGRFNRFGGLISSENKSNQQSNSVKNADFEIKPDPKLSTIVLRNLTPIQNPKKRIEKDINRNQIKDSNDK